MDIFLVILLENYALPRHSQHRNKMAEEYDSDVEVELDLSDSDVVTKYKAAAEIVNRMFFFFVQKSISYMLMAGTLQGVIQQCVAGKPVGQPFVLLVQLVRPFVTFPGFRNMSVWGHCD